MSEARVLKWILGTLIACLISAFAISATAPAVDPEPVVQLRDINFLLKKDGYRIYFRITEHGQLSLVHPPR